MKKLMPAQESLIGDDVYHEKKLADTMICGLCKHYDSDICYCSARGEHELYEEDTCDCYEECD